MGLFARILGRPDPGEPGDTAPSVEAPRALAQGAPAAGSMVVLVVNVETTGLSPAAGAGIHWCASLTLAGDQVRTRDVWAMADHEDGAVFGPAPSTVARLEASDAAARLAEAMSGVDVVVAHTAPFERAFVAALLAQAGVAVPATPWLDTMVLAKALHPDWPSFRLAACARGLGIEAPAAHDASAEAAVTADVFVHLRADAAARGVGDVASLLDLAGVVVSALPATPAAAPVPAGSYRAVTPTDRAFETSIDVAPVRDGVGIFVNVDDDPVFDASLSPADRFALLEARVAEHAVCGQARLKDITDPRHWSAHEAWTNAKYGEDEPAREVALRELVAAGCPNASEAWADSVYTATGATRGEFESGMRVLRVFKEQGFARAEDVRRVGANLRMVNDIKAGPKLLLAAWHELGPWLAGYAPCGVCGETGRANCRDLDLAYQAAQAMEWDANPGEMERVGAFFAAPVDAKPHLAGKAADYVALMDELRTSSPSGYARLACAVAEASEKAHPDLSTELYYENVRDGLAERYEFDRLSLLLERAKRFDDAADVAELGLAHPVCGATRGERLAKRVERCRAKAAAPAKAARPEPTEGGKLETLVCGTCGNEFTRVRTRGRKPTQCPDCRR